MYIIPIHHINQFFCYIGLSIIDSNLKTQTFLSIPAFLTSVTFSDSLISNFQIAAGSNLFTITGLLFLQISNFTAESVVSLDPTDDTSSMLNILNIALDHQYNSSVTNVNYVNSTITFIKISTFTGPVPVTKYFTFENMSFND